MPLTGGTFAGPELNGKLLPGSSADWQTVLPDGTALGDIRYTPETDPAPTEPPVTYGYEHQEAAITIRPYRHACACASYASGGGGASWVPRIAGGVTAGSALVSCVLVGYAPCAERRRF